MTTPAKSIVDSFREVVQDLLVPELKALRVSLDAVRTEMKLRDDTLRESVDAVRTEMRLHIENIKTEMQAGDKATLDAVHALGQKLDFAIDIRERLAALEARLPRQ